MQNPFFVLQNVQSATELCIVYFIHLRQCVAATASVKRQKASEHKQTITRPKRAC